ncbi:MAG TPA: hypothetical protein VIX59_20065 [Candidatus Binataceae bacterium]
MTDAKTSAPRATGIRIWVLILCAAVIGAALALSGCGHKLVAAPGERTVAVYPDEQTWRKVAQMKQQGGVAGMFGGLGQNLIAKQLDDQTQVKILSSDTDGATIVVIQGPFNGTSGFVPKENLN